jgi:hypothetical protein
MSRLTTAPALPNYFSFFPVYTSKSYTIPLLPHFALLVANISLANIGRGKIYPWLESSVDQ